MPDFNLYRNPNLNNALDGRYPAGNAPAPPDDAPTFSDRTKTVSASALGGGSGTDASPWTLTEAMQQAVAGDIVGIQAGVYVGVDPNQSGNARTYTPAFNPSNSGTAANPIIFVAQNEANISSTGLTDIRSGATGYENGWPAIGAYEADHVIWVGVNLDETNNDSKSALDSAPSYFREAVGSKLRNSRIKGEAHTTPETKNNHSGIRIERTEGFEEDGNVISGFNGGTNEAGIIVYKSNNYDLGKGEIFDCTHGVQIKGSTNASTDTIYGMDLNGKYVHDCDHFVRLGGPVKGQNGELSYIHNNIVERVKWIVEFTSSATHEGEQDGLRMHNNVFYDIVGNDPAGLWINQGYESSGNVPRDNKFYKNIISGSGSYWGRYGSGLTLDNFSNFMQCEDNVLYDINQLFNGSSSTDIDSKTLADWRALGQDLNSSTGDPLFTDAANGDFSVQAGSPAIALGAGLEGSNP